MAEETPHETSPNETSLLKAPDRVLATLNKDGTRNWIRPRLSPGHYYKLRRGLAYFLMVFFVVAPWLRIGGRPLLLLDLVRREFTFFGSTFRPTETPYLMLLLLGIFFSVFLLTALFGRVWCGWGCPQTVYMEFLFRPLERLFEGSVQNQKRIDAEGGSLRRIAKNLTFLALSFVVANSFLAYFVGTDAMVHWVTGSPLDHPAAFLIMAGVSLAMFFDFAWFREQTCLVVCPYGRFQSVLLDRDSLIVGYDTTRGEPRGKLKKRGKALPVAERAANEPGDCIDCGACVITCPTGIDIRDGLQMECVNCTQCMDACDAIMTKVGRPTGLIRYSSQNELAGRARRIVRPRVLVYAVLVLGLFSALALGLSKRVPVQVTVLRGRAPFALMADGMVQNQFTLKIENYLDQEHAYSLELEDQPEARVILAESPLRVASRSAGRTAVFVILPRAAFGHTGALPVHLRVTDEAGFEKIVDYRLLGPKD